MADRLPPTRYERSVYEWALQVVDPGGCTLGGTLDQYRREIDRLTRELHEVWQELGGLRLLHALLVQEHRRVVAQLAEARP